MEAISYHMYDAAVTIDSDHVSRAVDGRAYQDEAASSLSFASLLENCVCESLAELPAVENPENLNNSQSYNLLI